MTQEEKQLLLKDLCARLLYGVFVEYDYGDDVKRVTKFHGNYLYLMMMGSLQWKDFKPYLRPMSSMTEEEFKELTTATKLQYDQLELMDWGNHKTLEFYLSEIPQYCVIEVFDWLNAHHFDYRGLIEKGLAIEAPEGMYNIKTE